jgi:hypothetical protein
MQHHTMCVSTCERSDKQWMASRSGVYETELQPCTRPVRHDMRLAKCLQTSC